MLLERGATSHIEPQVGLSQCIAGSRILGILRAVPERSVLGLNGTVLRMVCLVHIPQPWRRDSPVFAIPRHNHLGVVRWLLDVKLPDHTQLQPDRPTEGSPRGGGPRTYVFLQLWLLHGFSKVLTGTHHRPDLPRRWLRYGVTQVLRA